jgi:hypothetical protein
MKSHRAISYIAGELVPDVLETVSVSVMLGSCDEPLYAHAVLIPDRVRNGGRLQMVSDFPSRRRNNEEEEEIAVT